MVEYGEFRKPNLLKKEKKRKTIPFPIGVECQSIYWSKMPFHTSNFFLKNLPYENESTSYTEETKQPQTVILLENLNENMILPYQRI